MHVSHINISRSRPTHIAMQNPRANRPWQQVWSNYKREHMLVKRIHIHQQAYLHFIIHIKMYIFDQYVLVGDNNGASAQL